MKIGMITDSLPGTDFDTLLATAARLELDMLEFGCGNWSSAPHLNLDRMLKRRLEPQLEEVPEFAHAERPKVVAAE